MKRLALVGQIKAGRVRWYAWEQPRAYIDGSDVQVAGYVRRLVAADLVQLPAIDPGDYGTPTLTPAGEAWLAEATKDGTE